MACATCALLHTVNIYWDPVFITGISLLVPCSTLYGIAVYSSFKNRRPCKFISGKVCLLASIKGKRQTLLEINLQGRLFSKAIALLFRTLYVVQLTAISLFWVVNLFFMLTHCIHNKLAYDWL